MDELDSFLVAHPELTGAGKTGAGARPQKYRCQKCRDTGWLIAYDGKYETMRRCGCYAVRQAEERMERSGISKEFRRKTFDGFETMGNPILIRAKNKAMGYVGHFREKEHSRRNSIMFCGQPGSGKTHLGMAICGRLLKMGVPVIYMAYRNAMTGIKQNMLDGEAYRREVGMYKNAGALYIDDLFKGRLTETDVNVMYEIVNHRYMNCLPLIISTEKDLNGLLMFDEATGSRIIEMCRGNITTFKGKEMNYRMREGDGTDG